MLGSLLGLLGMCLMCLSFQFSVPAVTVPFSDVNVRVVCQVVFSDSECELVESQTRSLSRKREAFFCGKSRRHAFRWNTREGTFGIQEKDYAVCTTAEPAAA